jgi:hypothetical protein
MVFAFLRPEELVFGTLRNLQKIAQTEDLKASRERILHMVDRALSWEGELTLDNTGAAWTCVANREHAGRVHRPSMAPVVVRLPPKLRLNTARCVCRTRSSCAKVSEAEF